MNQAKPVAQVKQLPIRDAPAARKTGAADRRRLKLAELLLEVSRRMAAFDTLDEMLRGTYRARELDLVVVKGKTRPVAIYEILDYHTEDSYPHLIDALGHFRDELEKYRGGCWGDAQALFSQALALNPADKSAGLYVERCRHLAENPSGDDWNGVWVMDSK